MIRNLAAGVRAFTSNAFLVTGTPQGAAQSVGESGQPTALVDTGDNFDLTGTLMDRVDDLETVVFTHTHPDHIGNLEEVREEFDVQTRGFDGTHDAVDKPLADGDTVRLGGAEFTIIHTPGHATDHVCLYAEAEGQLFTGDLVFANGGFGRTDLPGGNRETLVQSIERVREETGDIAELYPGHGPSVTDHARAHLEHALRAASTR